MQFNQMMLAFEHTLYANFHHLTYLPLILFLVAIAIIAASFNTKQASMRYVSVALAAVLVIACIFV